jgi:hypothetical protein
VLDSRAKFGASGNVDPGAGHLEYYRMGVNLSRIGEIASAGGFDGLVPFGVGDLTVPVYRTNEVDLAPHAKTTIAISTKDTYVIDTPPPQGSSSPDKDSATVDDLKEGSD